LNQDTQLLARYGDFIPGGRDFRELPAPSTLSRYSDEQLYALALYVYSLQPPPNPNKFDALAGRGQKVFESQGCAGCHTPPLYTNNKLTPVEGFTVPDELARKLDILPRVVGTDPNLALRTRRGAGFYKVPSLKGVWYRGPLQHNGAVATLEDWFDPRRLSDDYVLTGYKPYGVKTQAVKGHQFGLQLSDEDKRALIAFLKTL
jgi:Cytochrome c